MADANIGVKFGGCGIILERARMIPKKKDKKIYYSLLIPRAFYYLKGLRPYNLISNTAAGTGNESNIVSP